MDGFHFYDLRYDFRFRRRDRLVVQVFIQKPTPLILVQTTDDRSIDSKVDFLAKLLQCTHLCGLVPSAQAVGDIRVSQDGPPSCVIIHLRLGASLL